MIKTLRPYQLEAVEATMAWIRRNSLPCLLDLSVGAGKTVIIAEICKRLLNLAPNKKILVIAPNKELIEQNYKEYVSFGGEASYYSASISKSLRNPVIFASERSFDKVAEKYGEMFSCVIIDEADCTTPTIKRIVSDMKKGNPNIRVVGLSGTCFVLGSGYIYEIDENCAKVEEAIDPYYKKLLYRVTTTMLMQDGYLTKLIIPDTSISYDTSNLKLSGGNFTKESLDEAFLGHGKKTSEIIADVVNRSNAIEAEGVLIFGATVDHCHEIMASLPAYNSAMLTGSTPKKEREQIINDYKAKKIRFLVSVIITTRGFNAPHTKAVAVLRATQSARLLIQMAGRAIRLYEGKEEAYLWDYAGNYERFAGKSGNIFEPDIQAFGQKPSTKTDILCPQCNNVNEVSLRPLPAGYTFDQFGYILDLAGDIVLHETEGKPFPAHFSRRCTHIEAVGKNELKRCDYFWSFKSCPSCNAENDLAARKCGDCGELLIDPNDKLIADFQAFKKDLSQVQTDDITFIRRKETKSKGGQPMLAMSFGTESRIVQAFFSNKVQKKFYDLFMNDPQYSPKTVTYKKSSSGYMHIYDFNRESDKAKFERELRK